jgi:hypothetical protein
MTYRKMEKMNEINEKYKQKKIHNSSGKIKSWDYGRYHVNWTVPKSMGTIAT